MRVSRLKLNEIKIGLAKLKKSESLKNFIDLTIDNNSITFHRSGLVYKPHVTLNEFHDDDNEIRLVLGPFGSGKTVAMIAEIIIRACEMPFCKDGIRRFRCLVIRNTYNDLKRTCYKSWMDWTGKLDITGEAYTYQQSPMICRHLFNDGKGLVEIEVHFLPIDTEKQLRQLKSFETTKR